MKIILTRGNNEMEGTNIKISVQCDECAAELEVAYIHYLSVGVAIQAKSCARCLKAQREDIESQYDKGEEL